MSVQRDHRNGSEKPSVAERFNTPGLVDAAMKKAVRQALRRHKLLGESIAVSQDGKVVVLPPEEIPDYPAE